jgi:type II secretory pathway component PulJ
MIRHSLRSNHAGISLIEILVYIAIASMVFTSIISFQQAMDRLNKTTVAIQELNQQLEFATANIALRIRGSQTIGSPSTGSTGSTLTITPIGAGSPTTITLSSGQITIAEGGNSPIPITSSRISVSSLQFTNLTSPSSPGTIRIQFTASIRTGVGTSTYAQSITTSASLRP